MHFDSKVTPSQQYSVLDEAGSSLKAIIKFRCESCYRTEIFMKAFREFHAILWLFCELAGQIPSAVHADGDDFFDYSPAPLSEQLVFMGAVRDDKGRPLQGVSVTWAVPLANAAETSKRVVARTSTDVMGRFRTNDVAGLIHSYGYQFDPALVELTATKPGYSLVRRLRRTPSRILMGLVEVDFILAQKRP